MGGGKVSAQDMGWLASTGGGGKVAVHVNGVKVTPDVRTLDFTSSGSATVTANKVGGKITINIDSTGGGIVGDYVSRVNGFSGGVTLAAGSGIAITNSNGTVTIGAGTGSVTGATGNWGSFWDTTSKTVASTTTAYGITFNSYDSANNGVNLSTTNGSRVVFSAGGVYNLQFSAQLRNTDNSAHDATFWIRKNGNDVPETAGIVSVPARKDSNDYGYALPSWNWIIPVAANDYVELYWHTTDTDVSLHAYPIGANPVHPMSPSIIFTAQAVSATLVGPTGPTGATPTDYVSSFNGLTGAVQGVSSWNGQTGAVQFHNYISTFNGRTGSVQGVSSANGFTGSVTWAAGTGLEVSSGGGTITYGIGAGYALLRSVGNTGDLFNIDDPSIGDLVFVQDDGTYYYWDYYSPGGTYSWINISVISNALQGDLNGDGTVNGADLGVLLGSWGSLYNGASLRLGVQDGNTGAFRIFAEGSSNPKKGDMVRVSTEGDISEFRVNTDNLYLTGLTEINGENASLVALFVTNGKTELNGDTSVNGTLEILNGGISGGFIDGGTFV